VPAEGGRYTGSIHHGHDGDAGVGTRIDETGVGIRVRSEVGVFDELSDECRYDDEGERAREVD